MGACTERASFEGSSVKEDRAQMVIEYLKQQEEEIRMRKSHRPRKTHDPYRNNDSDSEFIENRNSAKAQPLLLFEIEKAEKDEKASNPDIQIHEEPKKAVFGGKALMFGKGLASLLLSNRPQNDESIQNPPKAVEETKTGLIEEKLEKKPSIGEKDILFSSRSEKTEQISGKILASSESLDAEKSPIGVNLGSEVLDLKEKPEDTKIINESHFLAMLDNEIRNNFSQTEPKFGVFSPSNINIRPSFRESIGSLDLEKQAFGVSVSPIRSLDLHIGPTFSDQIYPSRVSVNIETPSVNDHESLRKQFMKIFAMAEPLATSLSEPFHPIILPKDLIITGNAKRPLSPRIENNKLKLKGFEVNDLIKPFEVQIESAYPRLADRNPFSFVSVGQDDDSKLKSVPSSENYESSRKPETGAKAGSDEKDLEDQQKRDFSITDIMKNDDEKASRRSSSQGSNDSKYQVGAGVFEDFKSLPSDSEKSSKKKGKIIKKNPKALRSMKKGENLKNDENSSEENKDDVLEDSEKPPNNEKSASGSYQGEKSSPEQVSEKRLSKKIIGFGLGLIHDSILDKYYEDSEFRHSDYSRGDDLESPEKLFSKRSSKISGKHDLADFHSEKNSSQGSENLKKLNLDPPELKSEGPEIQVSSFPLTDYSSTYNIAETLPQNSAKFSGLSKPSQKALRSSKVVKESDEDEIPAENDFLIESKEVQHSDNPQTQTIEDIEVENVIFTLPENLENEGNLNSGTFSQDRQQKKEPAREKALVSPENLMRTPELDIFAINPSFITPESVKLPTYELNRRSLSPEYTASVYRVGGSDDEIDYHNFQNESFESPIRADSPVFQLQSPESSIIDSARNSIPHIRVFGIPSQNESFHARDSLNIPDIKSIVNSSGIFFKRSKLHLLRRSPRKLDPELFHKNIQGRLTAEEELSRSEMD